MKTATHSSSSPHLGVKGRRRIESSRKKRGEFNQAPQWGSIDCCWIEKFPSIPQLQNVKVNQCIHAGKWKSCYHARGKTSSCILCASEHRKSSGACFSLFRLIGRFWVHRSIDRSTQAVTRRVHWAGLGDILRDLLPTKYFVRIYVDMMREKLPRERQLCWQLKEWILFLFDFFSLWKNVKRRKKFRTRQPFFPRTKLGCLCPHSFLPHSPLLFVNLNLSRVRRTQFHVKIMRDTITLIVVIITSKGVIVRWD